MKHTGEAHAQGTGLAQGATPTDADTAEQLGTMKTIQQRAACSLPMGAPPGSHRNCCCHAPQTAACWQGLGFSLNPKP